MIMTPHIIENREAPRGAPMSEMPRAAVVAHLEDGVPVRAFGNEILFKLSTEQSGGVLCVGLATVPAGNAVPPHTQDNEDELFLIVDGEYRFWIDGVQSDVGPGALVFMPRGVPHTFQVLGERAGRHWVLGAPGGFDHFFKECADVFAAPGPPDFARLTAINAEYGNRFV
jgi:mannose-6-phosphate isomerase-like protein (cupin superfamily)